MMLPRAAIAATLALITWLGFQAFPGAVILYQDTQIWLPMLEHLWDPTVLARDIVATRPHFAYTFYDEIAVLLRKLSGLSFAGVLVAIQFLARGLGLLGVYWLGTGFGLGRVPALLLAGIYGLGATINGPAVLSLEYEPVPRGFAAPLLFLGLGLEAHKRWIPAAAVGAAAMLLHPPTVFPFLLVYAGAAFWPGAADRGERLRGLAILAGCLGFLVVAARLQPGLGESQEIFGRIDPALEKLQRMRASYNWISMWQPQWIRHYELLWLISLAAYLRIRASAPESIRFFLVGLPALGLACIPAAWLLLEKVKWSAIAQVQPARAVLFTTVLAGLMSAVAGMKAAREGRRIEGCCWLFIAYAIPLQPELLQLLLPDLRDPLIARRFAIAVSLAIVAVMVCRWDLRRPRLAPALLLAVLLLPFWLIPGPGEVRNIPNQEQPELYEMAAWARSRTDKDAVFLFPDFGKSPYPGMFRTLALRAVYVDWKGGGQVNVLKDFADQWWKRWQRAMAPGFSPSRIPQYASFGVDYLVLSPKNRLPGQAPAYENPRYLVYPAGQGGGSPSSQAD